MRNVEGNERRVLTTALCVAATVSLAASDASAQQRIELVLDAPYLEGFGYLRTVRELSDGRVMAADPLGQVLVVWGPDAGTADTLGRVGAGPQEYRQPDAVFPMSADSTLLIDLGNTRLTVIGPDGTFGTTTQMMQPRGGGFPMSVMPRSVDRQGRVYFYLSLYTRGQRPDSGAIARFDRATDSVDTLGFVRLADTEYERIGHDNVMRRGPLLPRDDWAASTDGSVAIVRAEDYSVEWILPDGRVIHGPPTPYQTVRVGQAERERWADEASADAISMTSAVSRDGSVSETSMRRGGVRPVIDGVEWPDVLPPFRADRSMVSPDGDLWVERFLDVGSAPVIDVFDRQGNKKAEVTLPHDSRVVGFGDGVVYLARADEFDLRWLERYRIVVRPAEP